MIILLKKKCGRNPDEASIMSNNHSLRKEDFNPKAEKKKSGCC